MNGGRQRAHRADGRDVENHSLSLPDHLFVHRLGHRKQTVDVRVNHFVPGAVGRGREVVAAVDGGVVDENIDAAPFLDQLSRQLLHADAIDDRYLRTERAPAVTLDLAGHVGGEVVARVVAKSHVGPFARKYVTNCRTYTSRSSGDERPLSLKQKTHSVTFLQSAICGWVSNGIPVSRGGDFTQHCFLRLWNECRDFLNNVPCCVRDCKSS